MKQTPFTDFHIAAGARMAEFAGYNMPVEFSGITDEHLAVRNGAGLFDVSHMGEIRVRGRRAIDLLQHITTNDVSRLTDGKAQYSCMPNGRGGIVDDILVYRFGAEEYLLVVNASNVEKDWAHIVRHGERFGLKPGAGLDNESDATAQLAIQGPLAMKIAQEICSEPLAGLGNYSFVIAEAGGVPRTLLSTTGYTGCGGCEIYVPVEAAKQLWHAVWRAGEKYGLKNIGLGARDTLRLEKGYCLYGNDMDDTTSPIEAGLGWITKLVDGKDFIDRPLIESQLKEGVSRRLAGFEMTERGVPRHGYALAATDGRPIGRVTSGTMSPVRRAGVGLGYVETAYALPDTEIAVIIRDRPVAARVVRLPFA
jgi:aminomethyltransferase